MKSKEQGYVLVFDRNKNNLDVLQKILAKRNIKMFGTDNVFKLLNYLKELKINALLVTLHSNDKPATALLNELNKQSLNFPLIIIKPKGVPLPFPVRAAHYLSAQDMHKRLFDILESYAIGHKSHKLMLFNSYKKENPDFCKLIPDLNEDDCFEVHSKEAAHQYLLKNEPQIICVEYGQPFTPVPHQLNRPHIFYVDRPQDIAEIQKFLQ